MSGKLFIIGLGPGPDFWVVPEASEALAQVSDVIGYEPYVARIAPREGLTLHGSDNRVEITRAQYALELALSGKQVAVVSGGDPGVFAMAAAVLEAVEAGPQAWLNIDIQIIPGISAMQAAAARVGAPLGHDFCAISLSDNLKPWEIIERRLIAAAQGDFVIALYNPASKARPQRIFDAFTLLNAHKSPDTPLIFARAVGRADESLHITTLSSADIARIDMSTLVLIGSSETRLITRPNQRPWVLTPRSYGAAR